EKRFQIVRIFRDVRSARFGRLIGMALHYQQDMTLAQSLVVLLRCRGGELTRSPIILTAVISKFRSVLKRIRRRELAKIGWVVLFGKRWRRIRIVSYIPRCASGSSQHPRRTGDTSTCQEFASRYTHFALRTHTRS